MEKYYGPSSPEVLAECLLDTLSAANHNVPGAKEAAVDSITVEERDFVGFVCKKAGCKMFVDGSVLYGTGNCRLVKDGEKTIPGDLL